MPTCYLNCEGCGTRHATVLDEQIIAQLQKGKTYPKHCLVCHTTTDWAFAFVDRRSGQDRRKTNTDRRQNPS